MSCLLCLKFTMIVTNFLCFICGIVVLVIGIYLSVNYKMATITPSLASFNAAHAVMVSGSIIICVSFLGFLGAHKANRCLLFMFFLMLFSLILVELAAVGLLLSFKEDICKWLEEDLKEGLEKAKQPKNATILTDWDLAQSTLHCCGVMDASDWGGNVPDSCCDGPCDKARPKYYKQGCLEMVKVFYEDNVPYAVSAVIPFCVIEAVAMGFAMALFCNINQLRQDYMYFKHSH